MSQFIVVEREGGIGRISIDRPERANALTGEMLETIALATEEMAADPDMRVVIIKGRHKGFSSGHDLSSGGELETSHLGATAVEDHDRLTRASNASFRLWDCPIPIIAQVHGYCIAGALELVMMCDLVVAAEDTRFGMPPLRGIGGTPLDLAYPFYLGLRRSKELLWVQEDIDGRTAERWGLINKAVEVDRLEAETQRWAERITLMPRDNLRLGKRQLHYAMDIIGFRPVVRSGAMFDAIGHQSATTRQWWDTVQEHGLKEAVRRRDEPFRRL